MILEPNTVMTDYQAEFVDQFLSSSDTRQLLLAPPGSGISVCAEEIISRVINSTPVGRVLVVTGRMLLLQWMRRIEDTSGPVSIVEGSRRNLRELKEQALPNASWPDGSVVVMDRWSLERFADLEGSVVLSPWDLVVWDGLRSFPATLGERRDPGVDLLRRLADSSSVRRLLVLSREQGPYEADLPNLKLTRWDRSTIERSYSRYQRARVEEVRVTYQRNEAELGARQLLEAFAKKWESLTGRLSPVRRLLPAARSSPLALQESLQRLRPSKSAIVLRQFRGPLSEALEAEEPSTGTEPGEIDEEITVLQNALDSLSVDSKLESLLAYLRSVPLRNLRTVIECRFAATARYLTSALADLDTSVVSATADLRPSDTLKILTAFEERGGILVATIPTLQGVEFAADLIVAYDSVGPWMRSAFRPRIRPLEDDKALRVVYLIDGSSRDEPSESDLES